ncbi:hypothetical protein [Pseudomonas sp. lyk4-R2A-10]|uniref:hypothetical protein n=1 Tax=Pseudomonas sp. lyk4-R2A-10 TaxID=3040315 RepID=UPI002555CA9E|nr:hypothetical protein [Pseudomonas sp. lyk4-R2A-10]
MSSGTNKALKAVTSFWFWSCISIVIAFCIAVAAYLSKFDGGLSGQSSDWSNFGSYIGGIFGPLVSFITLLAVLKTVYLQRELLDAQRVEFEGMQSNQAKAFEAQQEQIKSASEQAASETKEKARLAILGMIDRYIQLVEKKQDRTTEGLARIGDWVSAGNSSATLEQTKKLAKNNEELRAVILKLIGLSELISLMDYNTVSEMRDYYEVEIARIFIGEDGEDVKEDVI